MQPADAAKTAPEQHEPVLQISLAPAAVPLGVFNQSLWRFLVAAAQIVCQPYLPVFAQGAAQPLQNRGSRFVHGNGLRPGNFGRSQYFMNGSVRMMALCPSIVTKTLRPVIQPRDENRRIEAIGELLNAAKKRDSAFTRRVGTVWISPTSGCVSINLTRSTMVSPRIMLSASNTMK